MLAQPTAFRSGHCDEKCLYNGVIYQPGDEFVAIDGCSDCMCLYDGKVACSDDRTDGCQYAGDQYRVGESFPVLDGCNSCTCQSVGIVTCTLLGCGPM